MKTKARTPHYIPPDPETLAELAKYVYAMLIEHRYYSKESDLALVALQQHWIANEIGTVQPYVSAAFHALKQQNKLRLIRPPAAGITAIYAMLEHEILEKLPDTQQRRQQATPDINPDPAKTAATHLPFWKILAPDLPEFEAWQQLADEENAKLDEQQAALKRIGKNGAQHRNQTFEKTARENRGPKKQ